MTEPTAQRNQIETLYLDHHAWLQAWLCKRLGDRCTAEDIAQDTFVRLFSSRDLLLGLAEPRAYLTTTAKRLLMDRARRQTVEHAYLEKLAELMQERPGCYPAPDAMLMALEALAQISAALDGLAARSREAFLRHYLDDQPQDAIAADFGVTKRMVQKYLAQALVHCRLHCASMAAHGF